MPELRTGSIDARTLTKVPSTAAALGIGTHDIIHRHHFKNRRSGDFAIKYLWRLVCEFSSSLEFVVEAWDGIYEDTTHQNLPL